MGSMKWQKKSFPKIELGDKIEVLLESRSKGRYADPHVTIDMIRDLIEESKNALLPSESWEVIIVIKVKPFMGRCADDDRDFLYLTEDFDDESEARKFFEEMKERFPADEVTLVKDIHERFFIEEKGS